MKNYFIFGLFLLISISLTSCEDLLDDETKGETIIVTENITESIVWKSGNTYVVDNLIRIGSEQKITLTIEPGVTIKFKEDAGLDFAYSSNTYATLVAKGTSSDPIVFTSNSPNPAAGDWRTLAFYRGAVNCEMENCIVKYGGENSYNGNILMDEAKVSIKNCKLEKCASSGIKLRNDAEFTAFSNNVFSEIKNYPIFMTPIAVSTLGDNNTYPKGSKIYIEADDNLYAKGDFTWSNQGVPYVVDGVLRVGSEKGTNLTILAGTVINFMERSGLQIAYSSDNYGKLMVEGAANNVVTFTSNNPVPAAGDWYGIEFFKGVANSSLDHCVIDYAGYSTYKGALSFDESGHKTVAVTNTTISHSKSYAITVDDESSIDYSSVTFIDNEKSDYHLR